MKKRTMKILSLCLVTAMTITPIKSINAAEVAGTIKANEVASNVDDATKLINLETTWKYLDNNTDPGEGLASLSAWTELSYDDSAWKSAAGMFGSKKGALNAIGEVTPTVLLDQYYTNDEGSSANIPAYFFRTTFTTDKLDEGSVLKGTIQYDDGAIVYLNGKAIAYFGGAELDVSTETNMYYLTNGSGNEGAGDPGEGNFVIDPEELNKGENVIAVEVHQKTASSSDVFFAMPSLAVDVQDTSNLEQEDVILMVGSDETSRNLTWYVNHAEAGKVQVAKAETPDNYKEYEASVVLANDGSYANQVTITGLEANTKYIYKLVNGDTTSEAYSFETGTGTDFSFALVGDPQIGASGNAGSDAENWGITLGVIANTLKPDFLLSAGDQVNNAGSETEYDGYLNEILSGLASATTVGNHDSGSEAYGQHYNLPNESTELGTTTAGGDYWFVYNNTLFMGINSNDRSTAEHKAFMEQAIAKNPDVTWKTVFFHHSIYSTASHWDDSDIITRRNELPQVFAELDIDVVLMGHDHVYTRSKMMNVGTPTDEGSESEVYNPEGILYLTANSASGSKYYGIANADAEYSAKMDQSKRRTVTDVKVTDYSYTLTTYFADTMDVLDTYTIYKTDKTEMNATIEQAGNLQEENYTAESWDALIGALIKAIETEAKEEVKQSEIDEAALELKNAISALVEVKENTDTDVDTDADTDVESDTSVDKEDNKDQETSVEENPITGDTTNLFSFAILTIVSAGAVVISLIRRKTEE